MKIRFVALFLCTLFIATAFLGVGYAALTDELAVSGTGSAKPPRIVYISAATVSSGSVTNLAKSGAVLSSTVTLGDAASSTAVVRVTVKNNTDYPYIFNGLSYTEGEGTYDNTNITVSASIKKGEELASGASVSFDLTFKYKNGVPTNKVLNSVIQIAYIPPDEYIPEIAVKGAIGQFGEILNDEITFDKLMDTLNDTSSGRGNSYVGNVVGATDADSSAIEELFTVNGENLLTLDIGGKKTNVTALIKNEDIGGSSDTEMVIYMTGETISGSFLRPGEIQVFAVIYRKNDAGEWIQLGDLYEGVADSNNYNGNFFGTHNSFNTDTWVTAMAYHGVRKGSNIEALVAAIPEE